jgi:hypothetical protein
MNSHFLFLICLLGLATSTVDNVCDWVNASPILYHEYGANFCPPPLRLNPDGSCPTSVYIDDNSHPFCGGFCQIRTNFIYGMEIPFINAYCHYPYSCSLQESLAQGTTWKLKLPVNFSPPLAKVGITAGFSGNTNGITMSQKRKIDLHQDQCGYWTFLPIDKDTW